jgi:DNA-binding CsgD family transcriptional regulator
MVRAINEKDWSATVLGTQAGWPQAIRSAVALCLNSPFQLAVLVGPELVNLYNDAAASIFGHKHPWALGRPVREVWPEAWDVLGPMLTAVLKTGRPTRDDDLSLVLNRAGFQEECHFTVAYSPIYTEQGEIAGVFVAAIETTARVLGERRERWLADLARELAQHKGEQGLLDLVGQLVGANPDDLPLAALYLADQALARRVFTTGTMGAARLPQAVDWPAQHATARHPLARLARAGEAQLCDAEQVLGPGERGAPCALAHVLVVPLLLAGQAEPRGFLLVGLSPLVPFDASYRRFVHTAVGLVASAVASVQHTQAVAPGLTHRETDIVALIGSGLQVKQVAAKLGISVSSVNTYRNRIFRKLGLHSNAALIRYALHNGMVS